jgi:hypothetical protein
LTNFVVFFQLGATHLRLKKHAARRAKKIARMSSSLLRQSVGIFPQVDIAVPAHDQRARKKDLRRDTQRATQVSCSHQPAFQPFVLAPFQALAARTRSNTSALPLSERARRGLVSACAVLPTIRARGTPAQPVYECET